jgi:hypothetical protein
MIMVGQAERLKRQHHWGAREKLAIVALLACLLVGVVVAAIYAAQAPSQGGESAGCIDITFASTLGAAEEHACGKQARLACASGLSSDSTFQSALRVQCKRAGYPVSRIGSHSSSSSG